MVVPFAFPLFGGGLFRMGAMFLEGTRRRKFTELVTDHIFRHEDGIENFAVVHEERVADEIGGDQRAARPGLDRLLDARSGHFLDFNEKMIVDKWAFFKTTGHMR